MSIIGWKQIYNTTLTEAATSITIPNLTGDTGDFKLEARIVNGYNGSTSILVRPNNDSGANYGYQQVNGTNATAGASRTTASGFLIGGVYGLATSKQMFVNLFAKSGYVRTIIAEDVAGISGTTVQEIYLWGQSWNNTADEITSLVVLADQADGLGVGTEITLYQRATLEVIPVLTDTITLSDDDINNFAFDLIDSATLTDDISTSWLYFLTLSETATLTDDYSRVWNITRVLLETSNLTDLYSRIWDTSKSFSDSIDITDICNKGVTKKPLTETLTLTDIINNAQHKNYIVLISESITTVDILQEWLNEHDKTATWSTVSFGSNIWVLVSTSTNIWI